jgi:hypothetical protein
VIIEVGRSGRVLSLRRYHVPVPTVRLKIRVKLPNGSRAYVDPVFSSNNKLKPLYALSALDGSRPEIRDRCAREAGC